MGNAIDRRAQFHGGYLYVKTDRPYYYPGNVVQGKIHIRIDIPMNAHTLEIDVQGEEKASFMRHWTESYEHNGERKTRHHSERVHMHRNLIDVRAPCFTFGSALNPGDYIVPFTFTLPTNLPSSIMFHRPHDRDHPQAYIKYYITAILKNMDRTELRYSQMLVIHEPPVAFVEG